jgi:hypothetical protein
MMQRSGKDPLAGVSTADVITVFGTGKPEAGRAASAAQDPAGVTGLPIDDVVVAKPAH